MKYIIDAIARIATVLVLAWIAWELHEINDGITINYFMDTITINKGQ
jgi:hypothetical protein